MVKSYFGGTLDLPLPKENELNDLDKEILQAIKEYPQKISDAFERAELREAYKLVMSYATVGNGYVEKSAPWALMKQEKSTEAQKVLRLALNLCASLCIVASPFIPQKVKTLWQDQLNLANDPTSNGFWDNACKLNIPTPHTIGTPQPIFERFDDVKLKELRDFMSTPFDINEFFKK